MGKTRIVFKAEEPTEEKKTQIVKEKPTKKTSIPVGRIYINAGWNNTIVTITDDQGNVLTWSSTGLAGFKGTKKATPYAGAKAMETALLRAEKFDFGEVKVFVKGVGPGRDSALRVLMNKDLNVVLIKDITPIAFGGPTPPKPRRV